MNERGYFTGQQQALQSAGRIISAPPPMASGFGKYDTDRRTGQPLQGVTWREIQALVDSPQDGVEKDRARWVIPSDRLSRDQKADHLRPLLWLDIDDEPSLTLEDVTERVGAALPNDAEFECYTSRSATEAHQKCRVLIPLAQPLGIEDWVLASQYLIDRMGIRCDPASTRPAQVCYLPNRGEFYDNLAVRNTGRRLDVWSDWHPPMAEGRAALRRAEEATRKAQEAAKQRRATLTAAMANGGSESLIDAFCQAYDVADILTRAGYDQRGDTWRHPNSKTGSYSASVQTGSDGRRRVHTLSTSDPLHSDEGAHDAFSAFVVLMHGGDRSAALRDAGNQWLTIRGESWNRVQQREWAQERDRRLAIEGVFPRMDDVDTETGEVMRRADGADPMALLAQHPLAQFVDHVKEPQAVRWVIPGLIAEGVVTISGARGVGKTTALLPLAMTAAGLHEPGYALKPKHWRHVVYIVEDIAQAHRIISGMVQHGNLGIRFEDVEARLHLVEARRLPPHVVAQVGRLYMEKFTREVLGVELKPLVVFDTKSAILEMENENDNSEASRAMAQLRQNFDGLPVWTIGHIAKAQIGRSDVANLSDRGAGSFEGDTGQNCYLVEDKGERLFLLGKRRFEARWTELRIESQSADVLAVDQWGDLETTVLRWGILRPMDTPRQQAREEAEKAEERKRVGDMRQSILHAVETAWIAGNPINKTGVKGIVKGFKSSDVMLTLDSLMAEGWVHEVEVPKAQRLHMNKSRFLVKLSSPEWDDFKRSGLLPGDKLEVPQSWKKPGPEVEAEKPKI